MTGLRYEDFAGAEGSGWTMEAGGGCWPVELVECSQLMDSGREGGSFRLEFRGPVDPLLPQGTYRFRRDGEDCEIFVCPIGRDKDGTLYEAIFY